MRHIFRLTGALALCMLTGDRALAQAVPAPLQMAAECAPRATTAPTPVDALRLVGAQGSVARALFGNGDLVIVGGGGAHGVQLGQQFFVRRSTPTRAASGPRAVSTVGRIRVVAVNDTTTIALVELACDGLLAGDHLEAYVAPVVPADANRADTSGELDFTAPGRILFGDNARTTGATGDFMVTDVGEQQGAAPGMRFAIYRDVRAAGVPLAAIGEAIVVFTAPDTSVMRVTLTRDAIYSGDLLIPRRK